LTWNLNADFSAALISQLKAELKPALRRALTAFLSPFLIFAFRAALNCVLTLRLNAAWVSAVRGSGLTRLRPQNADARNDGLAIRADRA
jgi:hypothetical protein